MANNEISTFDFFGDELELVDAKVRNDLNIVNAQVGQIANKVEKLEQGGGSGTSTADSISISDANNNFTSTNVEGALSELFQSASNGKTLIANAITGKGVNTSSNDTFQTMATNIGNIQGLKADVVEFSQMNDLVTSYLANAESQYTNDNGNSVSVIENYATSTGNKDRPVGYSFSNTSGNVFIQDENEGNGWKVINPLNNDINLYNLVPNNISQLLLKNSNGILLDNKRVKPTGKVRMIKFYGYLRNCRDIGGWSCDGGTVKYGKIFRSATAGNLENADYNVIKNLNILHHIDLRGDSEANNITVSPLGNHVKYERITLNLYYNEMIDITNADHNNLKKIFKSIFNSVIYNEPLIYNCALGRDRTGGLTFMLLGLLGVNKKYVDIDYELSSFSAIENSVAKRTSTPYSSMKTYLATLGGNTLRDNIVWWFLKSGFSIDELNAFRNSMINGNPTQLDINNYTVAYSVTNNLTGCSTSNTINSIIENNSYSAKLSFTGNNNTWSNVVVTMGGTNITSTAYSNGNINISKVTGNIVITAVATYVPPYTNQIPLSKNSSGGLFESGKGWKTGYRIKDGDGSESALSNYEITGFIPCTATDTFRLKNIRLDANSYNVFAFYDSSYAFIKPFTGSSSYNPISQFAKDDGTYEGNLSNLTKSNITNEQKAKVAYIRVSGAEISDSSIITINEEIVG